MRDLIGGLIGVPSTILIAAGLGIVGLTVVSRIRGRRVPPIRWAHMLLGGALLGMGLVLLRLDFAIVGLQ